MVPEGSPVARLQRTRVQGSHIRLTSKALMTYNVHAHSRQRYEACIRSALATHSYSGHMHGRHLHSRDTRSHNKCACDTCTLPAPAPLVDDKRIVHPQPHAILAARCDVVLRGSGGRKGECAAPRTRRVNPSHRNTRHSPARQLPDSQHAGSRVRDDGDSLLVSRDDGVAVSVDCHTHTDVRADGLR